MWARAREGVWSRAWLWLSGSVVEGMEKCKGVGEGMGKGKGVDKGKGGGVG